MLSWSKHAGSEGSASNSGSLLFLVLAAFRDTTPSRVHLDMRSCQRPLELDPPVLHLSWRVGFSRPFLWRFKLWSETSICTRMQTRRLQISKSEWGWDSGRGERAEIQGPKQTYFGLKFRADRFLVKSPAVLPRLFRSIGSPFASRSS